MLKIFLTFDIETWCEGWNDIDRQFPAAFQRYIYGSTQSGDYGLPFILDTLNNHDLNGVFFVEPLFSLRLGQAYLKTVVDLILGANQEVQIHLHPEWVDEAKEAIFPEQIEKKQYLYQYTYQQQVELVATAKKLLAAAGACDTNAFRAGNYGCNQDTLAALARNGITFDSSYNVTSPHSQLAGAENLSSSQPREVSGVIEYPVSHMQEFRANRLRHLQLTACSYEELTGAIHQAYQNGWNSIVIVLHNFELLNRTKTRKDTIAVNRLEKLCGFLDRNREKYPTTGFHGLKPLTELAEPQALVSHPLAILKRMIAQQYRRIYG